MQHSSEKCRERFSPHSRRLYRRLRGDDGWFWLPVRCFYNRNKSSVVLDLRQPADQEHLLRLLGDADILLRPGSNCRPNPACIRHSVFPSPITTPASIGRGDGGLCQLGPLSLLGPLPAYFEAANLGARWNCLALPCAPDGDIGEPLYLCRRAGRRLARITFGNICSNSFSQRGTDGVSQGVS